MPAMLGAGEARIGSGLSNAHSVEIMHDKPVACHHVPGMMMFLAHNRDKMRYTNLFKIAPSMS